MVSGKHLFLSVVFIATAIMLVTTARADVGDGPCVSETHRDQTACGSSVRSSFGQGAIELCGDCFPCGFADGVCPFDFTDSSGTVGDCMNCPDPDCLIHVTGYVTDEFAVPTFGLNGVFIKAFLTYLTTGDTATTTTNVIAVPVRNGYYEIDLPRGTYQLAASGAGYVQRLVDFDTGANTGSMTFDFTMRKSNTCTPRCTTYDDLLSFCNPSCDGFTEGEDTCDIPPPGTFDGDPYSISDINYDLAVDCENGGDPIPAGAPVIYARIDENRVVQGRCCETVPEVVYKLEKDVGISASNILQEDISGIIVDDEGNIQETFGKVRMIQYNA